MRRVLDSSGAVDRPRMASTMAPAMSGRASSCSTAPSACAAAGMPHTTLVGSSWPIVWAPALCMRRRPSAPSRPMPVSSTPTARSRQISAALAKVASTPGTWNWPAGGSRSSTRRPPRSRVFLPAGATYTLPASRNWPSCAMTTGRRDSPSSQLARLSTKPSAMCWTTSTGTRRSPGSSPRIIARAGGPPVEAPMTTRRTPSSATAEPACSPAGRDVHALGPEPVARMGDDAHPAGDLQVAAKGGHVLR